MNLSPLEVTALVREQIEALKDVAARVGVTLRHVKPHGMLYNMAASDPALSVAIARAVAASGIRVYYGLAGAGSVMLQEAARLGLAVVGEGFADRAYQVSGQLLSRSAPGAALSAEDAVAQGLSIATNGTVTAVTGETVSVPARTICLHGDGPQAAELAQRLRTALEEAQVRVMPPEPDPSFGRFIP